MKIKYIFKPDEDDQNSNDDNDGRVRDNDNNWEDRSDTPDVVIK
ncbi:hypothetical protein [Flavivirga jejuensis]|uniref:Uncharacterized protein n=1 Tax=Flavivirga jejuensis TaxID=870487 RepID=A0ABT8WLL3_9FLAO|nr:hypothetical protein [Flavivirga jejuensis]MDO5974003.1 hypothetical protein [Flavivirga jejuensis]